MRSAASARETTKFSDADCRSSEISRIPPSSSLTILFVIVTTTTFILPSTLAFHFRHRLPTFFWSHQHTPLHTWPRTTTPFRLPTSPHLLSTTPPFNNKSAAFEPWSSHPTIMVVVKKFSALAVLSAVAVTGAVASLQPAEASHAHQHRGLTERHLQQQQQPGMIKVQKRQNLDGVTSLVGGILTGTGSSGRCLQHPVYFPSPNELPSSTRQTIPDPTSSFSILSLPLPHSRPLPSSSDSPSGSTNHDPLAPGTSSLHHRDCISLTIWPTL